MRVLSDWLVIGLAVTSVFAVWFLMNWVLDVLTDAWHEMKLAENASAGRSSGEAVSPHGEKVL